MARKKPYEQGTDPEKIQSQWHKLTGLHGREECSAAIVRAATAAEIAANFAIRREFKSRSTFSPEFVDSLLKWANGLDGKINRLLLPVSEGKRLHAFTKVRKNAEEIKKKCNAVAHQGEFCNVDESKQIIEPARSFIHAVVRVYQPSFKLRDQK